MISSEICQITVPSPPALQLASDGSAATVGQAYRLSLPSVASGAVTFTTAAGTAFTWTPTEQAFRDAAGALDFIVGSAPASMITTTTNARYQSVYPGADDIFVVEPERLKHYTVMKGPPRKPADYLGTGLLFGISGLIAGVTLPTGEFETIDAGDLHFPRPTSVDVQCNRIYGRYQVVDAEAGKQQMFVWFDAAFFMDPATVYPVAIDPTVATTTITGSGPPDSYQNNIIRYSNGVQLMLFVDSASDLACRFSTDGGTTWAAPAVGAIACAGTISYFSAKADPSGNIQIALLDANSLKHVRGQPDAARTSYTWSAVTTLQASGADWAYGGAEIYPVKIGAVIHLHFFYFYQENVAGSSTPRFSDIYYERRTIPDAGGALTAVATIQVEHLTGSTFVFYPGSIDVDSANDVHMAYGWQTDWKYALLPYGGGTWPAVGLVKEVAIAGSGCAGGAQLARSGAGLPYITATNSAATAIKVARRGAAGGWTDMSPPAFAATLPQGFFAGSDYKLVYKNSGVKMRTYSASAWSVEAVIDSDTTSDRICIERPNGAVTIGVASKVGSVSPWTIKYTAVSLNTAPTAPDGLAPAGGAGFDAATAITLSAVAHDTPGDYPSNALWEIQENVAGATVYYVKADGTLATVATWVPTAGGTFNISRLIAAAQLTNGKQWKFRVTTQDAAGAQSPPSAYAVFVTSAPPTATITAPASGATLNATPVTITATVADPEGKPLGTVTYRLYADNAGAKGALVETQAAVPSLSKTMAADLTVYNGGAIWLEVQPTDGDGITGPAVAQRNPVNLTPSPTPTITAAADNANGRIRVVVTNPPPGAGQPIVLSNEIWRLSPGGAWVRIAVNVAPNGTFDDYSGASGVAYTHKARAVANNSSTAESTTKTTTLALTGVWLHDVTDPAGTVLRLARNTGRNQDWEGDVTVRHFAGRILGAAEWGEHENRGADFDVLLTADAAAWGPLLALIRRKATLCVRDNSGRRLFGIVPKIQEQDMLVGGQMTKLAVTEIDYSEAV